jgi:maltooligosyltrehalose trehalohydrolase
MAKAVSEGRRREFAAFGWNPEVIPDPEKHETFERSKLNWDEVHQGAHAEMLDWFTRLIHLRRSSPALNDGDSGHVKVSFDEEKRWLTMERGPVRVMCNLGDEVVEFENSTGLPLVLASHDDVRAENAKVVLPPDTFALLSGEKN